LFGSPASARCGESTALPFERRSQLLVFLALKRAWVGRNELAAMLWPEQATKLAYSNLRKTLFRLRSVPWAIGIQVQAHAVRFEADTDVYEFECALREGRVTAALAVGSGELLAGFDDDANEAWTGWLGFERDRLRTAWRGVALEHLAGDVGSTEGIELSAKLLSSDPRDEAALREHMRWLAHGSQTARARQAYREFSERLANDLGLAPAAELRSLHDSLAQGIELATPSTAVPAKAEDGFVGRSVELRRITAMLAQDDCRLLCLIGLASLKLR